MSTRDQLVEMCMAVEPGANRSMQRAYVESLISLCMRADAGKSLDIGTNSGTSALSAASAMLLMGKEVTNVTTFDIYLRLWQETQKRMAARFQQLKFPADKIVALGRNFKTLDPSEFIPDGPVFIFYDIHDLDDKTKEPCSPLFIKNWIPLVKKGILAIHDINACAKDWARPAHWSTVPSADIVESWTGQWYRGFGEVTHFIAWANSYKAPITSIPETSIIWFELKDGAPVR